MIFTPTPNTPAHSILWAIRFGLPFPLRTDKLDEEHDYNGSLTAQDVAGIVGLPVARVRRLVSELREAGLIEPAAVRRIPGELTRFADVDPDLAADILRELTEPMSARRLAQLIHRGEADRAFREALVECEACGVISLPTALWLAEKGREVVL